MSLFNERVAQKRPTASRMKSELDRYLEDELVPVSQDKFNVLDWWKVAEKTLSYFEDASP